MGDWLQVVWNKEPRLFLRKEGVLVLYVPKDHLTMNVGPVVHAVNIDGMVIFGGMTS
jgi:hypothetical protein